MDKTALGDRMKQYEAVSKNYLMRREPVIVRLDGKSFHSYTRGLDKPFDKAIEKAMKDTMLYLCKNIQGCELGYTQSDEITLVLCDYQKIDTDAWFEYNVQKIVSVAASMATFAFHASMEKIIIDLVNSEGLAASERISLLEKKLDNGAFFDARVFSLPRHEVVNCLIWRQQDATRNSIQALAQSLFSHKEIQGINCKKLQDKIFTERGVNWNDLSTYQKRGACAVKKAGFKLCEGNGAKVHILRHSWVIDDDIPIFTEHKEYVNNRINFLELGGVE